MSCCEICKDAKPVLITSYTSQKVCKNCFIEYFEETIHKTIIDSKMFFKNEKVAIGMSGGKDSTVLAHVLRKLNKERGYCLDLHLVAIDEGISGYRDKSLEMVYLNQKELDLPLKILSYKELYNYTLDDVVRLTGRNNTCTKCGTFRRHSLEIGAGMLNASALVTGHNADDVAETVLLNFFRGDYQKLKKCTFARTTGKIARCKPFKYTYQREIVMYAFYKNLKFFSTECVYYPGAYRENMRLFLKGIERIDRKCIINIIKSANEFELEEKMDEIVLCEGCGVTSRKKICQACSLKDMLSKIELKD